MRRFAQDATRKVHLPAGGRLVQELFPKLDCESGFRWPAAPIYLWIYHV